MRLTLAGVAVVTGYHMSLNIGTKYTTSGTAALVVALSPALTLLLAAALGLERAGPRRIAGLAVAFAGVAVVVLLGAGAELSFANAKGPLIVIGAPVAFALYNVLLQPLLQRYGLLALTAASSLVGMLGLAPLRAALHRGRGGGDVRELRLARFSTSASSARSSVTRPGTSGCAGSGRRGPCRTPMRSPRSPCSWARSSWTSRSPSGSRSAVRSSSAASRSPSAREQAEALARDVAPAQSRRPERRRSSAMGCDGSEGCVRVRHWLSQTPSVRLAMAEARSRRVVPSRSFRWKRSRASSSTCLEVLEVLKLLLDARRACPFAPQAVRHRAQPERPERGVGHLRVRPVHWAPGRFAGEERIHPFVGRRERGGVRILDPLDELPGVERQRHRLCLERGLASEQVRDGASGLPFARCDRPGVEAGERADGDRLLVEAARVGPNLLEHHTLSDLDVAPACLVPREASSVCGLEATFSLLDICNNPF